MCLISRYLEENGLPTVSIGSALDIFQSGKPPRAVFTNYPLGHSAGKPFDEEDQYSIFIQAIDMFKPKGTYKTIRVLNNHWGDKTWEDEAKSTEGQDTREPRDETPQFQDETDILAAKQAGEL